MRGKILGGVLVLWIASAAFAQQTLLGTYSGSYSATTFSGSNPIEVRLTLDITSLEDGIVKGKGMNYSRPCYGEYPLEGILKGNELKLDATRKGGPAGDCGMSLRLTVDGNKLVGTMGKWNARLSK